MIIEEAMCIEESLDDLYRKYFSIEIILPHL
jgi:hypothetical protein